jgi:hypothetical protein
VAGLQIGQQFLDRLNLGLQLGQVRLKLRLALGLRLEAAMESFAVVAAAPAVLAVA